jgi:hypothetical protein
MNVKHDQAKQAKHWLNQFIQYKISNEKKILIIFAISSASVRSGTQSSSNMKHEGLSQITHHFRQI